jgi:UDP-GlcNAc:undecaprenyl-phosphate GlcNAc-1-phosphate transferase
MNILIIFILSITVALTVTFMTRKLAAKYRIGEYPDKRKVHRGFMPHMGGFGIFAGFVSGIAISALLDPICFQTLISKYAGILIASAMIIALGAYDDLKGLNAPKKFCGQFIAVTVIIAMGCKIETIYNPFGPNINLGVFSIPITYLWLIGVSNAVNLLDGLDGLAAGVSVIVTAIFLIIACQNNDAATIVITISLLAGLLGFLKFNYYPASIFMGDTGSLFLGLILAALSIRAFETQPGNISILVPVIALAIPIGDTSIAFFRRLNKGRHPFKPDKDHLHHRLIYLGLSHNQAVHLIYLASLLFGLTAYLITTQSAFFGILLLLFVIVISIFGLKRIGYLEAQRIKTYYGDESIIKVRKEIAPICMTRFWHKLIIAASDIIMINLTLIVTWQIRFQSNLIPAVKHIALEELIITPVTFLLTIFWISLFVLNNLYNMRWDISRFDKARRLSKVVLFGILILFIITIDPDNFFTEGRFTLIIYGLLLLIFVNSGRLIVIGIEKYFSVLEYASHNTLLVGATEKSRKLLKNIRRNPHLLYNVVGYVSKKPCDRVFYDLPPLGVYEDIPKIIRSHGIEEIIIAINERSRDEILNIVAYAQNMTVAFKMIPLMYDVVSGHKTEEVMGHPLIRLFPERMYLWQWVFKRLFDIGFATVLLIISSPLWLIIMAAQFVSGIYPYFEINNIIGKDGNIYGMLTFNYRRKDKKEKSFTGKLLYRSRLYKFPVLINIVLGKMSFVGPRPETVQDINRLKDKIKYYNRRFQIRPGLTGWAQVKYRYEEELKHKREQLKQDLFYLENMSLMFDFRILLRSLIIFLFKR